MADITVNRKAMEQFASALAALGKNGLLRIWLADGDPLMELQLDCIAYNEIQEQVFVDLTPEPGKTVHVVPRHFNPTTFDWQDEPVPEEVSGAGLAAAGEPEPSGRGFYWKMP